MDEIERFMEWAAQVSGRVPVSELQAAGALLQRELEKSVWIMRSLAVMSWAEVGEVLGVSKQAAHKRWRYVDDLDGAHFGGSAGVSVQMGEDEEGTLVWFESGGVHFLDKEHAREQAVGVLRVLDSTDAGRRVLDAAGVQ